MLPPSNPVPISGAKAFAIAFAAIGADVALWFLLRPWVTPKHYFLFMLLPVLLCAQWLASAFAYGVLIVGGVLCVMVPYGLVTPADELLRAGIYLTVGTGIIGLTERSRQTAAVVSGERAAAEEASERFRTLLESNLVGIVLGHTDGRVFRANRSFARMVGYEPEELTSSNFRWMDIVPPQWRRAVAAGIAEAGVNSDGRPWRMELRRKDGSLLPVLVSMSYLAAEGEETVGFVVDLTAIQDTGGARRRVWRELLQAEETERRRVARDLHDSTAQHLAAASTVAARLRQKAGGADAELWRDLEEQLRETATEIRTASYLLHPPLLDELGFVEAARVYVEGFARRSNVSVQVDIAADLPEPSAETGLAAFRVIQEALRNVERHAGSPTAQVRIRQEGAELVLKIEDRGRGIGNAAEGLGLSGMRERVRLLGGSFQVESEDEGTRVTARLPLAPA